VLKRLRKTNLPKLRSGGTDHNAAVVQHSKIPVTYCCREKRVPVMIIINLHDSNILN
jgi:hypothetical protein